MQTFEEIIIKNWAERFQCAVSTIGTSGTTLIPDEKYVSHKRIVLWHIGNHTFAVYDPNYSELLKNMVTQLPLNTSLSGKAIRELSGSNSLASHDLGLIHYLSPSDLPNLIVPATFSVRELSLSDEDHLAALHSNCTPEEVDDGYVEADHEIVFGCFNDTKLVSAASGYRIAGFMDIGVLTHPNFRKLGLGKAVVGALCARTISQNIVAQYRCNIDNTNSLGVAKFLNFRQYFSSENLVME